MIGILYEGISREHMKLIHKSMLDPDTVIKVTGEHKTSKIMQIIPLFRERFHIYHIMDEHTLYLQEIIYEPLNSGDMENW